MGLSRWGVRFVVLFWALAAASCSTPTASVGASVSAVVDQTQSVSLNTPVGWLESASVEWPPLVGADGYHVYYQRVGSTAWTKIDAPLVRTYPSLVRADVLGLPAGDYNLKVIATAGDTEFSGSATAAVTVLAHDRTGFAFGGTTVPGVYQADGALKSNAQVVYVTNATKDTVTLTVTGATANPCVGLQAILDGYKKGSETRPLAVRLIGNLTDLSTLDAGDLVVENGNSTTGITIEGVGKDATANGWGLRLKGASYVEVRNIGFMNCDSSEGDDVGLQQDNSYVWVHNCDLFYGNAGSDADQVKGDGALDTKKSNFITLSYNHFWDNGKCNLLGLSEGVESTAPGAYYITYHHNWYDHSDSRHPRVRYYNAHVYNNYYDGNAKYGAGSTLGSSVFLQNNYFRNTGKPMMISMQGTDVYATGTTRDPTNLATFSQEDGGMIKASGNTMTGDYTFIPYGATEIYTEGTLVTAASRGISTTTDFDAYVVTDPATPVPTTVTSFAGAKNYSNFDTNGTTQAMYAWTPDTPDQARTKTMAYAGRTEGGDLRWTFDNGVDDESSVVNAGLKAALTAYTGTLVSVPGSSTTDPTPTDPTGGTVSGATVVTFSTFTSGETVNGFTIVGSTSTSKGSCTVNGTTYTSCLKMESGTKISFTTTTALTLSLVFGGTTSASGAKVLVDGTAYTTVASGSNFLVTVPLAAGDHTVTKSSSINLFYLSLD
jgi:pectate lyase